MYRIESPECPQKLMVSIRRNGFIAGLLFGAALTFGAMHVPWPKPDVEVPSKPNGPIDDPPAKKFKIAPPPDTWSPGPMPLPTKENDPRAQKEVPFPLPTKPKEDTEKKPEGTDKR
jgi:hypothetical protein